MLKKTFTVLHEGKRWIQTVIEIRLLGVLIYKKVIIPPLEELRGEVYYDL